MVATTPLPSLIRASAYDAANMQMRGCGRSKWSVKDYNKAADTQTRLIRACYGYDTDESGSKMCFVRFGVAESMERNGMFHMKSKMETIYRAIDTAIESCQAHIISVDT